MCRISQHARERGRERWHLQKSNNVDEIIRETYSKAELVGEYTDENHKQRRILVDVHNRRVLVVEPSEDVVVTVWTTKTTPLALDMYDDVIRLHRRRIGIYDRSIRGVMRRYNKRRDNMVSERDKLDAEIQRMKIERDHIDALIENYEYDLRKLNEAKKTTLHSLSNYIVHDISEYTSAEA